MQDSQGSISHRINSTKLTGAVNTRVTMSAKRRDRCSEKEKFLVNTLRRESRELDRTLRFLSLQCQRELSTLSGAQEELQRALARLSQAGSKPMACKAQEGSWPLLCPFERRGPERSRGEHCCPNHIVCSKCNLRMRLADNVTRRFTPSLWTMYCRGPRGAVDWSSNDTQVYRIPSYILHRNLSASDNSLRYLPFISL